VVPADDIWGQHLIGLIDGIRARIGDVPTYVSFDIDALDPGVAPGTGTPEIGGLTAWQGLQLIRGCRGLNVVGCDIVEVSPPYDPSGNTALVAANLAFELLCILPGVSYNQ
jgi:guanidinobutyrase